MSTKKMSSSNTSDSQSSSMNEASASVIFYISYIYTCTSCFSITAQVNIGLWQDFISCCMPVMFVIDY